MKDLAISKYGRQQCSSSSSMSSTTTKNESAAVTTCVPSSVLVLVSCLVLEGSTPLGLLLHAQTLKETNFKQSGLSPKRATNDCFPVDTGFHRRVLIPSFPKIMIDSFATMLDWYGIANELHGPWNEHEVIGMLLRMWCSSGQTTLPRPWETSMKKVGSRDSNETRYSNEEGCKY
mmetsp:Transcript_24836/g.36396  ORF Transcript_24836/g.36396 Transcript_24836/m.36396 type:complete len:175 (-) Transcript_24836:40-564(-)